MYISQPRSAGSKPAKNQPKPSHTPPRRRRSSQMSAKKLSGPGSDPVRVSWEWRTTGKRGRTACGTCRGGWPKFERPRRAAAGMWSNLATSRRRARFGEVTRISPAQQWAAPCAGERIRGRLSALGDTLEASPNSAPPLFPSVGLAAVETALHGQAESCARRSEF